VLDKNNAAAKETKGQAMLALAAATMNSQARNMLLSDYLLMTGQNYTPLVFGDPEFAFRHIQENAVKLMPMNTLHRILAVNLIASKSTTVDLLVGLQLTDVKKNDPRVPDHYTLNVRKGILEVNPPGAGNEAFVINTDVMTWKKLVLYQVDPQAAVDDDKVVISGGDPASFYAFMDLFDYHD